MQIVSGKALALLSPWHEPSIRKQVKTFAQPWIHWKRLEGFQAVWIRGKAGVLRHKAFKGALNKLYGYAGDEDGIRHSLLYEGAADVDREEAVFIFGACAVFCDYLLNRHQQIK